MTKPLVPSFGAIPADPRWREVFDKAMAQAAEMVRRVPRLESVSQMIGLAP